MSVAQTLLDEFDSDPKTALPSQLIDKQWLREKFAEMDAHTGFVPVPEATIERLREMMLADGVRPEENEVSREILHQRYPEDFPKWQSRNPEPEA